MGFIVKEENLFDGTQVIDVFEKLDDAINIVFDSSNRQGMSIIESNNNEPNQHIFGFNEDCKIISVDHQCIEGGYCEYNDLEKLNR